MTPASPSDIPSAAAPAPLGLAGRSGHPPPAARVAKALARLRDHLEVEGDDLIACCRWLGGERWRLLAQSLVDGLARAEAVGRWQRALLVSVHKLVSLDLASDEADEQAGWMATVDLHDPRVLRCCRHSEALGELRAALDAADVARRRAGRRVHRPAA